MKPRKITYEYSANVIVEMFAKELGVEPKEITIDYLTMNGVVSGISVEVIAPDDAW